MRNGLAGSEVDDFAPERRIGHLLRRVSQRAMSFTSSALAELDITPVQAVALMALQRAGALSQAELGRAIGMEPANVHGLVLRLMKLGHVARAEHPDDRRQLQLRLTPVGIERAQQAAELTARSSQRMLEPLRSDEREQLFALLERLAGEDDQLA